MKKKVIIASLLTALFVGLSFFIFYPTKETSEKIIFKSNSVNKEDALFTIVTFGNRIEDDQVYFIQWETLNESEKESVKREQDLYLFSQSAFQDKQYTALIKDLISKEKTVMFYGFKMDLKKLLADRSDVIPYFEIGASKEIFTYLYGYGRSIKTDKMLPITVMGNFTEKEMSYYILDYLKSTYAKKAD